MKIVLFHEKRFTRTILPLKVSGQHGIYSETGMAEKIFGIDEKKLFSEENIADAAALGAVLNAKPEDNVELEEVIFTSVVNLFNLFRADICVDQAGAVRRRADSLAEFLEEGDRLERRFLENL